MTTEDAVNAITSAASASDASVIRNTVALEAMRGQRPEADADACREAFHARWSEDLVRQHCTPLSALPKLYWTGD